MTTPVSITFKIEKADKTGRYVAGWLSVVEKDGKRVEDTQGDLISMDELRKGVHRYMNGERTIKKQHAGGEIGKMVEVVMIDDDFAKAHGITHTKRGAWGLAEITDEATRDDVKKGRVTGWSMGGKGKRTPIAKARMKFADGTTRKLSRRAKREIRTQNAVDTNLRNGSSYFNRGWTAAGRVKNSQSPVHPAAKVNGKRRMESPNFQRLTGLRNKLGTRFKYSSRGRVRKASGFFARFL